MDRRFFSGNTLEQAVLAAAREFSLTPDEVAYRQREKKHGFLKVRRRVVIEVDASAPKRTAAVETEAAESAAPSSTERTEQPSSAGNAANRGAERTEQRDANQGHRSSDSHDSETRRKLSLEEAVDEALEEIATFAQLEVEWTWRRDEEGIEVELSGEDADVLLEDGGELLRAIEHVLPRLIRGFHGHGLPVKVDSGGFHASHEVRLQERARRLADEVAESGGVRRLEPMAPADRRVVHMALADDPRVSTESDGDGLMKRVRVQSVEQKPEADEEAAQEIPWRPRQPGGFAQRQFWQGGGADDAGAEEKRPVEADSSPAGDE